MRHRKGQKKLNRSSSHRRALLRNMAAALITHGQIRTTLAKAKALKPFVERLITLAKRGDLHARRIAASRLYDAAALAKLFGQLAERHRDRQGGYTRIIKSGFRRGDNAPSAVIAFVDHEAKPSEGKPAESKPADDKPDNA